MTFDTVEDFWACYHHVQLPSKLPMGSDYMLFKDGIQPKWEDEQNRDGGKWAIETDKKYRPHLDGTWLETLLAVIGEGNFTYIYRVRLFPNNSLDQNGLCPLQGSSIEIL